MGEKSPACNNLASSATSMSLRCTLTPNAGPRGLAQRDVTFPGEGASAAATALGGTCAGCSRAWSEAGRVRGTGQVAMSGVGSAGPAGRLERASSPQLPRRNRSEGAEGAQASPGRMLRRRAAAETEKALPAPHFGPRYRTRVLARERSWRATGSDSSIDDNSTPSSDAVDPATSSSRGCATPATRAPCSPCLTLLRRVLGRRGRRSQS